MSKLELSLVQEDCTSCGLCPEIAKTYFFMGDDGLAYIKSNTEEDPANPEYYGFDEKVLVGEGCENQVIEAAEECPGECIYVEVGALAISRS